MHTTLEAPTDTTHRSLLRVRALLGAIYDDLATASRHDPEAQVLAELAGTTEEMQRRITAALAHD